MISLEHLTDSSPTARNFDTLARLVLDTGGLALSLRYGSGTATWSASATSAVTAVTHGLSNAPAVVFLQQAATAAIEYGVLSKGSTSFTVEGFYTDHASLGNLTGTFTFYWVAIG